MAELSKSEFNRAYMDKSIRDRRDIRITEEASRLSMQWLTLAQIWKVVDPNQGRDSNLKPLILEVSRKMRNAFYGGGPYLAVQESWLYFLTVAEGIAAEHKRLEAFLPLKYEFIERLSTIRNFLEQRNPRELLFANHSVKMLNVFVPKLELEADAHAPYDFDTLAPLGDMSEELISKLKSLLVIRDEYLENGDPVTLERYFSEAELIELSKASEMKQLEDELTVELLWLERTA